MFTYRTSTEDEGRETHRRDDPWLLISTRALEVETLRDDLNPNVDEDSGLQPLRNRILATGFRRLYTTAFLRPSLTPTRPSGDPSNIQDSRLLRFLDSPLFPHNPSPLFLTKSKRKDQDVPCKTSTTRNPTRVRSRTFLCLQTELPRKLT